MTSSTFNDWLLSCYMQGPASAPEDTPQLVLDALKSAEASLRHDLLDIKPADLEGYTPTNKAEAWSLYLYLRFHQRYELLPFFESYLMSRYSLQKTVYNVISSLMLEKSYSRILAGQGIKMAADLLHRGWNPALRYDITERTRIPYHDILTLTRACDISRMMGMMGKTLYRCMSLGYTSMYAFRQVTPEVLKDQIHEYLLVHHERTSAMVDFAWFSGQAHELPDLVVYEE